MASVQFLVTLCAVAAILVARVESTCNRDALQTCSTAFSTNIGTTTASSNLAQFCKVYKTYLDCEDDAGIVDCGGGNELFTAAYDLNKSLYVQACGAAQFLMSWPMYITVLALSLKHLYTSAV